MVVRDQELTILEFIANSERFGPVMPHPSKSMRHPDWPKITMFGVDKCHADGRLRQEIYRRGAEGCTLMALTIRRPSSDPALCGGSAEPRRQYPFFQWVCVVTSYSAIMSSSPPEPGGSGGAF